ncbi:MAG: hypothetical protein U1D30_19150 [Planctomycetota bacterium]
MLDNVLEQSQEFAKKIIPSRGPRARVAQPPAASRSSKFCIEPLEDRHLLAFTPIGNDFQVEVSLQTLAQPQVAVAADAHGNYVIVWETDFQNGGETLFARRFKADGTPLGDEFRVNAGSGNSGNPAVAMDDDGDFVVVWERIVASGFAEVRGRRFSNNGTPLTGDFLIHDANSREFNVNPSVAMDADGDFVVVWKTCRKTQ